MLATLFIMRSGLSVLPCPHRHTFLEASRLLNVEEESHTSWEASQVLSVWARCIPPGRFDSDLLGFFYFLFLLFSVIFGPTTSNPCHVFRPSQSL